MKNVFTAVFVLVAINLCAQCFASTTLIAVKAENPPIVDGNGNDPAWKLAGSVITHDKVADNDIALQAVYTEDTLFFQVRFSDPDESRTHKLWMWNAVEKMYEIGPQREDVFVIKWAMDEETDNLSIYSDQPYMADIWFWKACRTDPAGYADDKNQILMTENKPKSMKIMLPSGNPMYLQRKGDRGKSAYKIELFIDYQGESVPQFIHQTPTKSRADIKAKGVWANNEWCIEFSRALKTGNDDDIQFDDLSKSHVFGVSRYEIAGKAPNPNWTQPFYGSGDVSEKLILKFKLEQ